MRQLVYRMIENYCLQRSKGRKRLNAGVIASCLCVRGLTSLIGLPVSLLPACVLSVFRHCLAYRCHYLLLVRVVDWLAGVITSCLCIEGLPSLVSLPLLLPPACVSVKGLSALIGLPVSLPPACG